jgi:hypothetical protein
MTVDNKASWHYWGGFSTWWPPQLLMCPETNPRSCVSLFSLVIFSMLHPIINMVVTHDKAQINAESDDKLKKKRSTLPTRGYPFVWNEL